jgi:hypothetical protein
MNGHDFDAEHADERRRAALAALELETRALNAERALENALDEVASLRAVALGPSDGWTRAAPTVDGFYWFRRDGNGSACVAEVLTVHAGVARVWFAGSMTSRSVAELDGSSEWQGPLSAPGESGEGTPDGDTSSWQDDRIVDLEQQLEAERDWRIAAERERDGALPQHTGCVPLADVQKLLATCEARYAEGGLQAGADVLDELAHFVVAQGAAARGGE